MMNCQGRPIHRLLSIIFFATFFPSDYFLIYSLRIEFRVIHQILQLEYENRSVFFPFSSFFVRSGNLQKFEARAFATTDNGGKVFFLKKERKCRGNRVRPFVRKLTRHPFLSLNRSLSPPSRAEERGSDNETTLPKVIDPQMFLLSFSSSSVSAACMEYITSFFSPPPLRAIAGSYLWEGQRRCRCSAWLL